MNIFVYGCSASDSVSAPSYAPSWATILANKLKANLFNRAISGGSTENAYGQWARDFHGNNFQIGDLVIFQTSTLGRLIYKHQDEFPETASKFLWPAEGTLDKKQYPWYYQNKDYIEWGLVNLDYRLCDITHEAYKHTLKSFAEDNPHITVIILEVRKSDWPLPHKRSPQNFFRPNIVLNDVFENEFKDRFGYNEWTKYTKWDSRINHMCIPNLHKLATAMEDIYLNSKMLDSYDDYFLKNVFPKPIENVTDYYRYLDEGLIYNIMPHLK